jgi:hypothetical protein
MDRGDVLTTLKQQRSKIRLAEETLTRLRADAVKLVEMLDSTVGDGFTVEDERTIISIYWGEQVWN